MDPNLKTLAAAILHLVEIREAELKRDIAKPDPMRVGGNPAADKEYQRQIDESQKPWRDYTAIADAVRKLAAGT